MNYYNEFDPNAAAWLRALIAEGLIPAGDVDERSITDVTANELSGYTQCHFFAGIGGWSLALQLAGWSTDRPVWTGSCPCQPFSAAGKQRGKDDERHLWPEFFRLIRERRPSVVFGEQVASKLGREWLAGVFAGLETVAYDVAGADLCAAGVTAPHIRQRLFWVGVSNCSRWEQGKSTSAPARHRSAVESDGAVCGLDDANCNRRRTVGNNDAEHDGLIVTATRDVGAWSNFDILYCTDGKARRVESGTFPLAHGIPGRVGLLRGYGNAIVPQVAAEFIRAAEEAIAE